MAAMALVFVGGGVWLLWGAAQHWFAGNSVAHRLQGDSSRSPRAPRLRLMHLEQRPADVVVEAVNLGGLAQRPMITCEGAQGVQAQPDCAWHAGGRVRLTFGFPSPPGPFQFTVQYQDQLGAAHTQAYKVEPSERLLEPMSRGVSSGRDS